MSQRRTDLLTTRQLADSLGVSESSVKRWIDEGEIAAERTSGGHRRVPIAAAMRFMRARGIRPTDGSMPTHGSTPALGPVDDRSSQDFELALVADDLDRARAILSGRFLSGADLASIADGLVRPAFERIGELWKCDRAGIMAEHRAVDGCITLLKELANWIPRPDADAPRAVVCGAPGDPYLLPPLIASLVLRERGFDARSLGPFTPLETMVLACTRHSALLGAVSVSVPQSSRQAHEWAEFSSAISRAGARLVIGGRCVDPVLAKAVQPAVVCSSMTEFAAYASGLRHGAPKPK
ncbi:MAG: helix-turn-helix domain-containing protein [Phycisphaerae bacterium]|nr:helix-turn-helix domain-containing protein [Phycisphaerae bacterium]